jgi:hypothetical protein
MEPPIELAINLPPNGSCSTWLASVLARIADHPIWRAE